MMMKKEFLVFLALSSLLFIFSCTGDSNSDDDIFNFSVTENSTWDILVDVDYKYFSDHGDIAGIGDFALDEDGELPDHLHSFLLDIQKGEGSVEISVAYLGNNPVTTVTIKVFMYDLGTYIIFYDEDFEFEKTWYGFK